jgi:hypothetical protein
MANESDKAKDDAFENLTSGMFTKVRCPRRDALVVFIPKNQEPTHAVQKILDEAGSQRWYPKNDGHLVMCPNIFDNYDDRLFNLEKNAWDHEHCDKCGKTISADTDCWISHNTKNYYMFCDDCYKSLK